MSIDEQGFDIKKMNFGGGRDGGRIKAVRILSMGGGWILLCNSRDERMHLKMIGSGAGRIELVIDGMMDF